MPKLKASIQFLSIKIQANDPEEFKRLTKAALQTVASVLQTQPPAELEAPKQARRRKGTTERLPPDSF